MFRIISAVSAVALLTACGTGEQPFEYDTTDTATDSNVMTDETTGTTTDEASQNTNKLDAGVELPPGTDEPNSGGNILRFEARDGEGGGLVTSVS